MLVEIVANAALLTAVPTAFVLAAISPNEFTIAVTFVLFEHALILLAVRPYQMTVSMHLIVEPVALILLLVAPNVGSFALDFVHLELSVVDGSVSKGQLALAILLALVIFSLVDSAIRPRLKAESVLFVIAP